LARTPTPAQYRFQKTTDKARRDGLPTPTEFVRQVTVGDGRQCDGCGETIQPSDMLHTVSIFGGLSWRFHEVCYEAWKTFKRQ
jgi:methionyl-tRNA synthetase